MMHHATKRGLRDCPGFLNSTGRLGPKEGRKCYVTPAFSGVPIKGKQNQKSKPSLRVTMMHRATKRGFKDSPGFLKSTGRLGPKEGENAMLPLHSRGSSTKGNKIRSQNLHYGSLWCTTQQSVDSEIVPVFSIAPGGWGPKKGGNARSPLHSRGSPTKGNKVRSQNLR